MMTILEIVLGLVFTFLLMSLLATVIQEMVASLLSLRGRVLLDGLVHMLEKHHDNNEVKRWRNLIKETDVYSKFRQQSGAERGLPSYLTSEQVVSVLQELVEEPAQSEEEVTARGGLFDQPERAPSDKVTPTTLKDRGLRNSLMALKITQDKQEEVVKSRGLFLEEGATERGMASPTPIIQQRMEEAKSAISENFNGMMDHAAGWYKRRVQLILFIIGFVIAFIFDADTFEIYHNLSQNSEARREVIAAAQAYIATAPPAAAPGQAASSELPELRQKVEQLINEEIERPYSALGLGRRAFPEVPDDYGSLKPGQKIGYHSSKFFGWLVTTLAITLGAPFWFDLLKLLMNVRNAGRPPAAGGRPASGEANK